MRVRNIKICDRDLFVVDELLSESLNRSMHDIVPNLPFSKTQYSNYPSEDRRWAYNFTDKLSTEIQVKSGINFKDVFKKQEELKYYITGCAEGLFNFKLSKTC